MKFRINQSFALVLFVTSAAGHVGAASHERKVEQWESRFARSCEAKMARNTVESGDCYVSSCFRGLSPGPTGALRLLRQGGRVCGLYSAVGGISCSRVYDGRVVGTEKNGILKLFFEDGHHEAGSPVEEQYIATENYLKQRTGKRLFDAYARKSVSPSNHEGSCPNVSNSKIELRDYRFLLDGQPLEDFPATTWPTRTERPISPPPAAKLVLHHTTLEYHYADHPLGNNLRPRTLVVNNRTSVTWTLSYDADTTLGEACIRWQASETREKSLIPSSLLPRTRRLPPDARMVPWDESEGYPTLTIPPYTTIVTWTCRDTTVTAKKTVD